MYRYRPYSDAKEQARQARRRRWFVWINVWSGGTIGFLMMILAFIVAR